MAEVKISDSILSSAVAGWLELDGLLGYACSVADAQHADDCAPPLVVLFSDDEYLRSAEHSARQVAFGSSYAALRCPFAYDDLSDAVRSACAENASALSAAPSDETTAEPAGPTSDDENRTVSLGDVTVALSPREYRLYSYLSSRANTTVSREELCREVWDGDVTPSTNTVDVYVSYLRRKIEPLFGKGAILSVRGEGYMLVL